MQLRDVDDKAPTRVPGEDAKATEILNGVQVNELNDGGDQI